MIIFGKESVSSSGNGMSLLPRRERAREFSFRKVYGFFYENRFVGSCTSFGILDSKLPKGSTLISQGMAPHSIFCGGGNYSYVLAFLYSTLGLNRLECGRVFGSSSCRSRTRSAYNSICWRGKLAIDRAGGEDESISFILLFSSSLIIRSEQ